jgi:hypothetical protein
MAFIIGLGNKCLDIKGGVDANGTPIILFDPHGGNNQQWTLTSDGFIISALNPGKCLDIPEGVTDNGTPILLFDKHGGVNQKWSLTPEGLIVSALDQNKCLDVKEGTDANETPIILFDKHGGANQKWRFSDTLPPKPSPSPQPAFPIKGSRHDDVAGGHMQTDFTLDAGGTLSAVTRTWTNVKLKGFTGSVTVVLTDGDKQPLWASPPRKYGVDGELVGDDDRHDNWNETVPSGIINQVRGYAILQQHDPKWLSLAGARAEQFLRWLNSDEGKATIATIATIAVML